MFKNTQIMIDSGAPSLYNTLVRKEKGGGYMGSYLQDRKYDDFSFVTTKEYKQYLRRYILFIKKYLPYVDYYINLDVINNAEETWNNQLYMESKGLKPIPVFHFGSDTKWLQMYIDKGYDFIALGGMVPNPKEVLLPALDDMWSKYLIDKNGMPLVKVHGFAITAPYLFARYPWFSVDSTSWVKYGKYGVVCVPKVKGGKRMYGEPPLTVTVSNRSPSIKLEGKHINTFSPAERKFILNYFEKNKQVMGKSEFFEENEDYKLKENERFASKKGEIPGRRSVEKILEPGLSNDYKLRDQINVKYYLSLEASVPEWPWAFKVEGKRKGFRFNK